MVRCFLLLALGLVMLIPAQAAKCKKANKLTITQLDTFTTGCIGSGCMEILAYDKSTKYVAGVSAEYSLIAILDVSDPNAIKNVTYINVGADHGEVGYGGPNSVAARDGYLAVAMDAENKQEMGYIRLYSLSDFTLVSEIEVCAMPDDIKWRSDGSKIYVACEGEPASQEDADTGSDPNDGPNPEGYFGIVSVSYTGMVPSLSSTKLLSIQDTIDALSDKEYKQLLKAGFRVDPRVSKKNAAIDIEPEYIALDADEKKAFVTLQENNAVMKVDLVKEKILGIWPVGLRSLKKYGADISDKDGGINIATYDNVYMWRQPDTIVERKIGETKYYFIANEGDSKEEALRVKDIGKDNFDMSVFTDESIFGDAKAGRFNMDPLSGLANGYDNSKPFNEQTGYNKIIGYGARSMSIHRSKDGKRVWESKDAIEQMLATHPNASKCFHADREENACDSRSDNRGSEPEALEVFELDGCWFAALGLERQGGFVIFDVTNPEQPSLLQYVVNRDFGLTGDDGADPTKLGNLAPEMIKFVSAEDSPNGNAMLMVTHEVSGQISLYDVTM